MLMARHLGAGELDAAKHVMRLAGLSVFLFSVIVQLIFALSKSTLGLLFCSDEFVQRSLGVLSTYVAPMMLLKAVSGLFGQYLAVTGRSKLSTSVLFVIIWCLGLPVTWMWASFMYPACANGAMEALMQAHLIAWLLAASCFAFCYMWSPKMYARLLALPLLSDDRLANSDRPASSVGGAAVGSVGEQR